MPLFEGTRTVKQDNGEHWTKQTKFKTQSDVSGGKVACAPPLPTPTKMPHRRSDKNLQQGRNNYISVSFINLSQ